MKSFVSSVLLFVAVSSAFAQGTVGDWYWTFPKDLYKELEAPQRSSVDRASKLLVGGENLARQNKQQESISSFRAAADEFKRFGTEFLDADENALGHASFLRGYALQQARDRNKAVEVYTETIDFYEGLPAAACATYWRARCYDEMGMKNRSKDDWESIADGEDYENHPLSFYAQIKLGNDLWGADKPEEAVARWQAVCDNAGKISPKAREEAGAKLWHARMFSDFEGLAADTLAKNADKPAEQVKSIESLRNSAWWAAGDLWWRDHWFNAKRSKKFKDNNAATYDMRQRILTWFDTTKPIYTAANRAWDFEVASLDYWRSFDAKVVSQRVPLLAQSLRALADDRVRDERAIQLLERLKQSRLWIECELMLGTIKDARRAAWARHGYYSAKNDWKAAAAALEPLEKDPDVQEAEKAKRAHAGLCKDRLGEYETAITLYNEAPQPPSTLWSIAECHRALGAKQKAQMQLVEIASMFPDQAPRAMMRQGDWYLADGDKKNAIGMYRRILANMEWKKTQEASQAHQALERLGIATGGAVVGEVH